MGGVISKVTKPFTKPFRTGASAAKRQMEDQKRQLEESLKIQQAEREAQENVAQAQAKLAEDSMFEGEADGLGITGVDTEEVGGKRKRRRRPMTDSGLGIG